MGVFTVYKKSSCRENSITIFFFVKKDATETCAASKAGNQILPSRDSASACETTFIFSLGTSKTLQTEVKT